jgi:hypothetical protein
MLAPALLIAIRLCNGLAAAFTGCPWNAWFTGVGTRFDVFALVEISLLGSLLGAFVLFFAIDARVANIAAVLGGGAAPAGGGGVPLGVVDTGV